MVDVGVRQKHKINLVGVDGELLILKDVFALFHAAVDETILAAALQKVQLPVTSWAAPKNVIFMGCIISFP